MQVLSRFFSKKLIDRHDSGGWGPLQKGLQPPCNPGHTPCDQGPTAFDTGRAMCGVGHTMLGLWHAACDKGLSYPKKT